MSPTREPYQVDPRFAALHNAKPITLHQVQVSESMMVGRYFKDSLTTETDVDRIESYDGKIDLHARSRLTGYVLAEHLPPQRYSDSTVVVFEVPDGWWQTAKAEVRWLRPVARRWPPRMRRIERTVELRVDLQRYRAFPEANVQMTQELGRPLRWCPGAISDWHLVVKEI